MSVSIWEVRMAFLMGRANSNWQRAGSLLKFQRHTTMPRSGLSSAGAEVIDGAAVDDTNPFAIGGADMRNKLQFQCDVSGGWASLRPWLGDYLYFHADRMVVQGDELRRDTCIQARSRNSRTLGHALPPRAADVRRRLAQSPNRLSARAVRVAVVERAGIDSLGCY